MRKSSRGEKESGKEMRRDTELKEIRKKKKKEEIKENLKRKKKEERNQKIN